MSTTESFPPNAFPQPRSFKRAFASTFAGNLAIQGLGAVSGVVAARILGPEGRGELAAVYFYPGIIALLGILSVPQAVAFEVSRRPEEEERVLRAGFWLLGGDAGLLAGRIRWGCRLCAV